MLVFDHSNRNGTGTRMSVDVTPCLDGGAGGVAFTIERQPDEGNMDAPGWRGCESVAMELDATQVGHVLSVLCGERKGILDGRGLTKCFDGGTSILHVDACETPYRGYGFHIIEFSDGGSRADGRILLDRAEGRTLKTALESAMGRIAFGE